MKLNLLFLCAVLFSPGARADGQSIVARCAGNVIEQIASENRSLYQEKLCFWNAGELGRKLKAALGERFDENAARILVIKHREYEMMSPRITAEQMLFPQKVRELRAWKYHAVLEYQGLVYDLDHAEFPKGLPMRRYFLGMFPPTSVTITKIGENTRKENFHDAHEPGTLHVAEIPLRTYLELVPSAGEHGEGINAQFFRGFEYRDLETYLR